MMTGKVMGVLTLAMAGVAFAASGGAVNVGLEGDIAAAIATAKEMLADGETEVTVNLAEGRYEPQTAIVLDAAIPCIDTGVNSVWDGVAEPKDLDGKPRIDNVGKVVDLGCQLPHLAAILCRTSFLCQELVQLGR